MSPSLKSGLTPEEYLALERRSLDEKHDDLDGELFLMPGASEPHNQIVVNLSAEIHRQFKGRPCRVYSNDMRVRIPGTRRYFYPDLVAVAEAPKFEDEEQDTLVNPVLIIEVLSASTEIYDRGAKFESYGRIDTVVEYVLVSQTQAHIERFQKQTNGQWLFTATIGIGSFVDLSSVGCRLSVTEIYDKIAIP